MEDEMKEQNERWRVWSGRIGVVAVLVAGMAACGDDEGSGELVSGTGPEAAASYTDYLQLLTEAYCASYVGCCGDSVGLTQQACIADLNASDDGRVAAVAGIEAGRLRLDAAAARQCASALRSAGCDSDDVLFSPSSRCFEWAVAAVPNGGACSNLDECMEGVCAFDDEADTEGTCTPVAAGEPCLLSCRTDDEGERNCNTECPGDLSCEADVCVLEEPDPGIGEACEGFCDFGAWCNDENVCEATRPAGAPCDDDEVCESYECVNGQCTEIEYCF